METLARLHMTLYQPFDLISSVPMVFNVIGSTVTMNVFAQEDISLSSEEIGL